MKGLIGLGALLLGGATFAWLWQRNTVGQRRMAEMLQLSPVQEDVPEESGDPARSVARRWQRPILRGQINGDSASVWQRAWYLAQGDSRPYLRAPFCVLAFDLPAPAPVPMTIEPLGLQEDVPPLASRWPTLPTGDPAFDAQARITSPQPDAVAAQVTPELRRAASDFFARFACDDPTKHRPDLRRAVLGWFEVETSRVTYTTFGQPDEASAARMRCALPVLSKLTRAAAPAWHAPGRRTT